MTDTRPDQQNPVEQPLESSTSPSLELAATLLKDYYAPVFQLSLALLNCAEAAQRLTLEIFCEALPKLSRLRGKSELEITIFQIALRSLKQSKTPHEKPFFTEDAVQQFLAAWIEHLDDLERYFFFLYYLLDLQTSQIGKILHVSQGAVRAQIGIIQRQLAALFASQADEPALKDSDALEQRVREIVSNLWAVPQPSPNQLETYTQQVLDCTARTPDKKFWGENVRKNIFLAGVGLGLLLITLGTGYFMWQARGSSSIPPPAEPPAQGTFVQAAQPLTSRSTSEQIKARMLESASLWNILWADIQMTDYGPASYIGPQKSYRGQVWIKQPAESLELFGALGQKPNSIYIRNGAQILYENPVAGESISAVSTEAGSELLHNPVLEQLIFPAKGPWITQNGWLQARKTSKIAGRRCIVVDWSCQEDQILGRLWLDVASGLVLKRQDYTPGDEQTLLYETLVSDIRYESEA
ncbi:MAG: sigma-70 family RNA polymerase sigma factor, partial [Gemmatimonadota bacterium]|nr:sigma-70 family RNA polymerase sigma factor [Gemmatimonadota bacterium]